MSEETNENNRSIIQGVATSKVVMIVLSSIAVIALLLFLINLTRTKKEEQLAQLSKKMDQMSEEMRTLEKNNKSLEKNNQKLQRKVNFYDPFESIIYNAFLRDRVYKGIQIKPGDVAVMKADSSKVVVTDVIVGGNRYSYYVHYMCKKRNGESVQVKPEELTVVED
jgi:hypothetical protein